MSSSAKKAIIFGSSGQDGYYLNRLLFENGVEVVRVSRESGDYTGSVADRNFVENLIKFQKPDYIFNFAANSSTDHSTLFENHDTIATGSLNILEATYQFAPSCKVFLSGSALQFLNKGIPISESDPFDAKDVYSIARIHSVYAARFYRKKGLAVYIGYFFNHDSPLRNERHVNQKIVLAAKRIASKQQNKLELGDISVKKEFNFAKDIVEAVWCLINNTVHFEAVLGSGRAYTIEYWLDLCFGYYKLNWQDYVTTNKLFLPEYKILVSNPSTILSMGWKPKTSIENLSKIMLNADYS